MICRKRKSREKSTKKNKKNIPPPVCTLFSRPPTPRSGPGDAGSGEGDGGGDKPWTKEERAVLKTAMGKYPKGQPQRWELVSKEFQGRRSTDEIRRLVAEMVVAVRSRNNAA